MNVSFYELGYLDESLLQFVVILARYKDRWIFVRHKERETWEMPGGHIETGEGVLAAAKRELYEESGAVKFELKAVCDYLVESGESKTYGRLFVSKIDELGELPVSEIGEVRFFEEIPENLTYPYIQNLLFEILDR